MECAEGEEMKGRAGTLAYLLSGLMIALTTAASAGPLEKAKDAVDPDCTIGKAAKGAATKAVVGVRGNRCGVGETARDTLGVDDLERDRKDGEGRLKRARSD
jgi:Na+/H+-translocating membrane pyrophosphatase